ncbi:MAG TPA: hypothetical protein VEZ42_12405, partial [Pseudonocardia sp.]|nr:hypothetical protein [Pseudonocardia sp.]
MRTVQPVEWISRWCTLHNITRLSRRVAPPRAHSRMWWISDHDRGRSHPWWAQPRSRAVTARRSPSGIERVARPTSRGCPAPFNTTGMIWASQHNIRSMP